MTTKDRIKIHVEQIENLELQEEAERGIERFERLYKLKETDPKDNEVLYYSLSEIQTKLTQHKEILNELKNTYKDLHNLVS
jgi:hypothetical protein